MLLELAGQTALVKHGQLMAVWHLNADNKLRSAAIMPRITSLSMAAVPAGLAQFHPVESLRMIDALTWTTMQVRRRGRLCAYRAMVSPARTAGCSAAPAAGTWTCRSMRTPSAASQAPATLSWYTSCFWIHCIKSVEIEVSMQRWLLVLGGLLALVFPPLFPERLTCEQEAEQTLSISLPPDLQPGLVWVECQRGGLLSAAVPLVITPSRGLAVELNAHVESISGSGGLLTDLGLVLGVLRDGADLAAWQGTVRMCVSVTAIFHEMIIYQCCSRVDICVSA